MKIQILVRLTLFILVAMSVVYAAPGDLDNTFNGNGRRLAGFEMGVDTGSDMGLRVDGKIVVAGETFNGANSNIALASYNPDGSLDTTFEMVKFISTRNSLYFSLFYFLNVFHTPRDGDNLLFLFLKTNYKKNNLNYFVPFSG